LFVHSFVIGFFGRLLSVLPGGLLLNTWLTYLSLSILLTWQVKFNWVLLTNENISKSPHNCINSLLHRFSNFPLVAPDILLKTFLSKATSHLTILLFNVQNSAQYVVTGVINNLYIFIFMVWLLADFLAVHIMHYLHL